MNCQVRKRGAPPGKHRTAGHPAVQATNQKKGNNMSHIEFAKWYYQVGQDAAEVMADFYGTSLRQVAAWEASLTSGLYDSFDSASTKLGVYHG